MVLRDKAIEATKNSVEEHNTNQVSSESLKDSNEQHKQEISRLTEEIKLIKSSVAYFQVEAKVMSSEKNTAVSKVHKLQGRINEVIADLRTRVKKEDMKSKSRNFNE